MKNKQKITPDVAVAELKALGISISVADATYVLDFLYLIAEVFYRQHIGEQ